MGEADADTLGLPSTTMGDDEGAGFRMVTDRTIDPGEAFEHCFADPLTITDDETDAVVATIPPRTCISTDAPHDVVP